METNLAKQRGLSAAHFTAIGALHAAVLGFFDISQKEYRRFGIDEQVEVSRSARPLRGVVRPGVTPPR